MLSTPTRSSTVPIVPFLAPASSFGPGVPLAPSGPAIVSCPNFSFSVILAISALTLLLIALSFAVCPAPRIDRADVDPVDSTPVSSTAATIATARAAPKPIRRRGSSHTTRATRSAMRSPLLRNRRQRTTTGGRAATLAHPTQNKFAQYALCRSQPLRRHAH